MRKLVIAILVALPLAAMSAAPQTATLDVKNMTCALCSITVKKALEKVPGVSAVSIDFAKKTATVAYDPDEASPQTLTKATAAAGYPSTVLK